MTKRLKPLPGTPPRVATPRCEHKVQIQGWHDVKWRSNRYENLGGMWDDCTFPSYCEIDGHYYCRRHAGQIVLEQFLDGKLVPNG